MRKLLILIALGLFVSTSMFAQSNKRTSAYMYLQNGQLEKAKTAIDEAITHPKTENDAKTWLYRGMIYYNIARDTMPEVIALSDNAAEISFEAFEKCVNLDVKKKYKNEIANHLMFLTNIFYQKGANGFSSQNYDIAIVNFKKAFQIADLDGRFDTVAAYNVGMSAVYSEQSELAAEYLSKCVEAGYKDPGLYIYYAKAEKQLGDTTKAFEVLAQGRQVFPNESRLQLEEAQLYLETGENDKLIASLKESIDADPSNPNLYRVLGQTYENNDDTENAIVYYKKAIEINPDFRDVIFNIGAIYVNRAAVLFNEANNLPYEETEKYNKLKEEGDAQLKEALPYLEKSLALDPNDQIVIQALKEAYANLKMNDKIKELMGE